jgi:hypothetical protein
VLPGYLVGSTGSAADFIRKIIRKLFNNGRRNFLEIHNIALANPSQHRIQIWYTNVLIEHLQVKISSLQRNNEFLHRKTLSSTIYKT